MNLSIPARPDGRAISFDRKRLPVVVLLFLGLFLIGNRADAKPSFPPVVASTYTLKPGGKIASAAEACTLCHADPGPPKLNSYGKDVKGALDAAGSKQLTPEILHSIDNKDADGDGATNGEEFAADTLPGDPTSKPAATNKVASKQTARQTGGESADKSPLAGLLGLIFPKHAQHPAIVHLPIGAYMVSLLFDILAIWKQNRSLALAGYYNLTVAALASLVAVATGLLAWWFAFGHTALTGDLLYHLLLALTTTALIWILWVIRIRVKDRSEPVSRVYLLIGIIAFVVIAVTGHLGGNLTGVNG